MGNTQNRLMVSDAAITQASMKPGTSNHPQNSPVTVVAGQTFSVAFRSLLVCSWRPM